MNHCTQKRSTFHKLITVLLVISDVLSLFLSLSLAYIIRFKTNFFESIPAKMMELEPRRVLPGEIGGPMSAEMIYVITAASLTILWLFLFKYYGLYKEKRSTSRIENWLTVAKSVSLGTFLFLVATFFIRWFTYSRIVVVLFWFFDILFTIIGRVIIRNIEAKYREKGYDRRNVILVGFSQMGKVLYEDITSKPGLGYTFIGWIDDHPASEERALLGTLEEIPALVEDCGPVDIYIVDPHIDRNRILNVISDCNGVSARFKIMSGLFDVLTNKSIETISGFPVIEFGDGGFSPWKEKVKRLFDVCGSILFIIIFSPLFVLIPMFIKRNGSKAIFTQTRIGKDNKPFTIYKFCSMYPDADPYSPAPSTLSDARITPIGRVLRRTSLDELPQLFNVLKGDMSLVGPRPEMPFIVEKFNHWQRKRMTVKPGMTGVWQTMGRSELPLHENIEFDLYYIRNQSIFFDIQILFRTVLVVLFGKGAY